MINLKEEFIAIIPARGGSKGVPGKNIRNLGGHPLLAYSIAAAKLCPGIERTIVSTDSEEIAAIARAYGAETPFLRPAEFSGDRSPDAEFLLHAMKWMQANEGATPAHWVLLRPTTPLRDPAVLANALRVYRTARGSADSMRSGHPAPESPFKWFRRNPEGLFVGLTSDSFDPDYYNRPRQEFPEVYIPDGYVDIIQAKVVMETGSAFGKSMLGFISPVCREVDSPEDFEYLAFEAETRSGVLTEYMNHRQPGVAT